MPSAANGKSEKPAAAEAADNSPVRQIMTVLEHKIRNLEKRKSKLTSYRDLQKAGKELKGDQKIAVAKYDEVAQTLEFARELSKQVSSIALAAERESKKQAKKEAWIRYAAETSKIREALLIMDCLVQMGTPEVREDFLNGTNGAAKLTEDDLKILDDLYPEVTPKHEVNSEGAPGFPALATRAAEHLCGVIDGKPREVLGTTYAHIKAVVAAVHECGYFDKSHTESPPEPEQPPSPSPPAREPAALVFAPAPPPAPAAPPALAPLPAPAPYQLRPMPPITLQEVEHAYFAQQYGQPQQRPLAEVIGSQNFFFLQESEIDSPAATPAPLPAPLPASPPAPIPTQTFTNQHFVRVAPEPAALPPPPPHFPSHADLPAPAPAAYQPPPAVAAVPTTSPPAESHDWNDAADVEDTTDRRAQGQGDGQRYKRYGRGGGGRGASNGYRGRGYRQNDHYHRQGSDYQDRPERADRAERSDRQERPERQERHDRQERTERPERHERQDRPAKEGYNRQYNDGYQNRHKEGFQRRGNDNYYGNGDTGNGYSDSNGGRERYEGGYKRGGRGAARGGGGRGRAPRSFAARKPDSAE